LSVIKLHIYSVDIFFEGTRLKLQFIYTLLIFYLHFLFFWAFPFGSGFPLKYLHFIPV